MQTHFLTVVCTEETIQFHQKRGWPLLTVETESNCDFWSTYDKGHSLVCSLYNIFCTALAALVLYKIFSSPHTFSLYQSPSPNNLGTGADSRAGSPVFGPLCYTLTHKKQHSNTSFPAILHLLINTHNHIMMLRSLFCYCRPSPRSLPLVSCAFSLLHIHQKRQTRILAVESSTTSPSTEKTTDQRTASDWQRLLEGEAEVKAVNNYLQYMALESPSPFHWVGFTVLFISYGKVCISSAGME